MILFQKAVYVDSDSRAIMSVSLSDPAIPPTVIHHYGTTLVSDLAVDWVSDNVYWTNQTSHGMIFCKTPRTILPSFLFFPPFSWNHANK